MPDYKLEIKFRVLSEETDGVGRPEMVVYALTRVIAGAFGAVRVPAYDHHGIGVMLRSMDCTKIEEK